MAMHLNKWAFRLRQEILLLDFNKAFRISSRKYSTETDVKKDEDEEEFRVLQIRPPPKKQLKKARKKYSMPPPRTQKMSVNQDWTNVWPAQKTFHPAVVPLPVRQGDNKSGPSPSKFGNTELMKIPNFLHLTPPAIQKHCKVLKDFCTPWPEELESDEDIEKHFPVEVIDSDYCHASQSIRNPLSRIITIKLKLKYLELDKHAKDKFLRLVGARYDPKTDYLTITTDSCPMKQQNYDYAQYLLTALVYESWKFEDWEKEKSEEDMEEFVLTERKSFNNIKNYFEYNNKEIPDVENFSKAVNDWNNIGDDPEIIEKYKKESLKLLSLTPF